MLRVISIILALALVAISSGGMGYFHELEHHRDAGIGAINIQAADNHDEDHCPICATLHMFALAAAYFPLLVCLGILVTLLRQLAPSLLAQERTFSIDCRGPPAH